MKRSPNTFQRTAQQAPDGGDRTKRIQFDAGYEPVVLGKTMFIASSNNGSVTALDIDTGEQKWRFYTDGSVRLAPVAWKDRIFIGSDDGHLYCLAAKDGRLLWKFRAVPSRRNVLGNGRLISVWPVRGGPVLHDGKIYFAAGVKGASAITIRNLQSTTYTVRLYFAEPDHDDPGKRRFDIALNSRTVAENFDIAKAAGGRMRTIAKKFENVKIDGSLKIELKSTQGKPILSGVEIVAVEQ